MRGPETPLDKPARFPRIWLATRRVAVLSLLAAVATAEPPAKPFVSGITDGVCWHLGCLQYVRNPHSACDGRRGWNESKLV